MFKATRHANMLLAMSKYGYQQLLQWFAPYRIGYIPHGIDTKQYYPYDEDRRAEARKKLGLETDAVMFLCVAANAGIRKRLPVLLRIFSAIIKQGYHHVYLYLFTNHDPPYYVGYDLSTLIEQYGLQDNVFLPTRDTFKHPWTVAEMIELYNAADSYISTSQGEGFNLPCLEAMACGVPVLAPDNSTMPELLNNGVNGWLVKNVPNHVTSDDLFGVPSLQQYPLPDEYLFRSQILHILKNAKERQDKGFVARKFVEDNYTWDRIMPLWETLLASQAEQVCVKEEIKSNFGAK
jgi:glycosyltransferase involved in cell wall biosynthesis